MATRSRPAPGGGVVVEIPPDRLVGWINRFAGRNDGLSDLVAGPTELVLTGGDGTTATFAVPFPPMAIGHREPAEALLDHLAGLGTVAVLLVRGGAHSAGLVRDGAVLNSSTHRPHLQGRTAAGGWSQQRYARRRGNQLTVSREHAADVAVRALLEGPTPDALVVGGDAASIGEVLADRRLAVLTALPRRTFLDIAEPRRAVLDEIAERYRSVEITVRQPDHGLNG